MKVLFALTMCFSLNALASVPVINPKTVTCDELQSLLNEHGTLIIRHRFLGFPLKTRVKEAIECGSYQYPERAFYKTKDGVRCEVGQFCATSDEASCRSGGSYCGP